jgi:hypothetical protein
VVAVGVLASGLAFAYAPHKSSGATKLTDYYREAWPAYSALLHGHVREFLQHSPAYVGSLILRAPFAMMAWLWGGGANAVYITSAVPCMLAAVAFCAWLAGQPRRRGGIGWASRLFPIICCVLNPVVLVAIYFGHPEEVLGAVLCVAAVVLATRGKAGLAGLVTALAIINKPWALVVVPVVFAVLPGGRRRALLVVVGLVGAVYVPVVALRDSGLSASSGGTKIGSIFNAPELLWWFGLHSWIVQQARWLIGAVAFGCAGLWWWARKPARGQVPTASEALLLLALVLLLRAALDPWNNPYYHVPFLFALIAYETHEGRPPALTALYSVLLMIVVPLQGVPMSSSLRAAAYAVIVVPGIAWLAAKVYLPNAVPRNLSVASRFAVLRRGSLLNRA